MTKRRTYRLQQLMPNIRPIRKFGVHHRSRLQRSGIAWRSSWEVAHEVAAGRLVPLLEDFAAPPNGIYAVFPQRKLLPLRVRLWIDFLKHHYSQPGYWSERSGA